MIFPEEDLDAWNQKNLDYEIETTPRPKLSNWHNPPLEIKRTSITRLKPVLEQRFNLEFPSLKSKEPRLRDWNKTFQASKSVCVALEIKRTSITRLKRGSSVAGIVRMTPWNQKNLDYEIETSIHFAGIGLI